MYHFKVITTSIITISLASILQSNLISAREIYTDLEETNHVLFGTSTPIYFAKSNPNNSLPFTQLQIINWTPSTPNDYKNKNLSSDKADTVYLEVLVVVDYKTFLYYKNDTDAVTKYIYNLYTGYDLRFRQMTDPEVRLNVAGIFVASEKNALPFSTEENPLSDETLEIMSTFFANDQILFQNKAAIRYDLINLVLYQSPLFGIYEKDRASDRSHIGTACKTNEGTATIVTRTMGGFDKMNWAIHEFAHALGATHDDESSAYYMGKPCQNGYLMGATAAGENSVFFSCCSITAMQNFLRTPDARCLKNKPFVGSAFKKNLPGKIFSIDQQCQKTMNNNQWISVKNSPLNCKSLHCTNLDTRQSFLTYLPPVEGSDCDNTGICLNGVCVLQPARNS